MKKKLFIGSFFLIGMLMLLPSVNAIQSNAIVNKDIDYVSFDQIKNMDNDELLIFILEITKDKPDIQEEILNQIEEMEDKEKFVKPLNSNQSIFQRLWQIIYNYRILRFTLSAILCITMPNKITMLRTLTWSMKIIRWMKIGVLLGFIDPEFWKPPETPEIGFEMDDVNNTLTVEYVYPADILWADIDQIGSGSCDTLPAGTVATGDAITNCQGIIVLRYKLTNGIIGIFEFD